MKPAKIFARSSVRIRRARRIRRKTRARARTRARTRKIRRASQKKATINANQLAGSYR